MKTKVVIFDKDGTLIDFDAFWISLAQIAFEWMTEKLGRPYGYPETDNRDDNSTDIIW